MSYIISQVFVIISYALLALTYLAKDRKKILTMSFLAVLANAIAFILLGAWSGFVMSLVAMGRNIVFLIRGNDKKINYVDYIILGILYLIIAVSSYFTYVGLFSLFSVFGTMIYTYSAWQKNPKVYKLLGIPSSVCWIIYNIYVSSVFGAILESILLIFEVVGTIKALKEKPKLQEK
jgi:hypothetical protein